MAYLTTPTFNPAFGQPLQTISRQTANYAAFSQNTRTPGNALRFGFRNRSEMSTDEKESLRQSRTVLALAIACGTILPFYGWHESVHMPQHDRFVKVQEQLETNKKIPSYATGGNFNKEEFSKAIREACDTITTEKDKTLFCADIQLMLEDRGISRGTAKNYVKNIQQIHSAADLQKFMNTLVEQSTVNERDRLALRDFKQAMKEFTRDVENEPIISPMFWMVFGGIIATVLAAYSSSFPNGDLATAWKGLTSYAVRLNPLSSKRAEKAKDLPPSDNT